MSAKPTCPVCDGELTQHTFGLLLGSWAYQCDDCNRVFDRDGETQIVAAEIRGAYIEMSGFPVAMEASDD